MSGEQVGNADIWKQNSPDIWKQNSPENYYLNLIDKEKEHNKILHM